LKVRESKHAVTLPVKGALVKAYCTGLCAVLAIAMFSSVPARGETNTMMRSHMMSKCPSGDRLVIVNSKTKTYYVHTTGTMMTRTTSMHMCLKRAKAAGYHMAGSSMSRSSHHALRAASHSHMRGPLPSASPNLQTNPNNEQNGIQTTPTPNPQPTG